MVQAAFTDISKANFDEFFNLYRTTKVKLTTCYLKKKCQPDAEKQISWIKTISTFLGIWRSKQSSSLINFTNGITSDVWLEAVRQTERVRWNIEIKSSKPRERRRPVVRVEHCHL